ncbi:MAG: hypothetical protein ACR2NP_22850, partial [Pirellulaceae bacterium]
REVSPDEETGGTPDRSRKRSPRNLNRGAITFDEFRSRTPRNQRQILKMAADLDSLWESLNPRERMYRAPELDLMIRTGASSASQAWERSFWDRYARELRLLSDYYKGNWTDLEFGNNLHIWNGDQFTGFDAVSDESLQVKSRSPIHLLTDGLFDGAKTVEADLEFPGDDGGDFGLFVVARDGERNFNQSACWAAFNVRSGHLRSGVPGNNNSKDGSLIDLDSAGLDATGPLKLQLNVSQGYYQVLVNDRLILERYDDRITVGKAVGLAVHPASPDGADCKVSKCRVRRWKSGRPMTGSEFVEDELMYYDGASLEFPKVPDYPYRAAIANLGDGRIDSAARYARQSVELGLDRGQAALFVALDQERRQLSDGALKAWQATQTGAPADSKHHNTPLGIGRLYFIWFATTHPDQSVRNQATGPFDPGNHPEKWVNDRIGAAELASRGEFQDAVRVLSAIVGEVPEEFREATNVQLQAYRNGKTYTRPDGELPFYHRVPVRLQPHNLYSADSEF